MYCFPELITPKLLCEKYTQVDLLGWTPFKIALFLQAQLLIGVPKSRPNSPCLISEKSFTKLIDYSRELNTHNNALLDTKSKKPINLMTPMDLFQAYPRVKLNGWTAASIGMFMNCKLLLGIYQPTGRSTLITECSFFQLIDHANSILELRKVYTRK